jgi:hypothetical protein
MNSNTISRKAGTAVFCALLPLLAFAEQLSAYEMFVFRRYDRKEAISLTGKLTLRGELFGQLQAPSSFPSYNDLSGPDDRWTYGFQDFFLITPTTRLLVQLVTHDSGGERTKFDWHFSLRQEVVPNLVLLLGHDSEHDSDRASYHHGRRFYNNRNYFGVCAPFAGDDLLVEPFLRFFHDTTNQRTRLDLSGEEIRQESGLRVGARFGPAVTLSFQGLIQSSAVFDLAQAWLADLILRFRLTDWLEATVGGGIWRDWGADAAGRKQTYSKLIWGIAVPF